ncbi:MAG: thiopurine S-methyltransferase [Acidobacteria bacterium]|nr:thiopurine S-methyltransferase [Acidobacteriota bacterium]
MFDENYWHKKWETADIGFHRPEANPLLVRHFGALAVPEGGRVFLPLCGKTRDIAWLLAGGFRVAGAELSRLAVEQLFAELGLRPKITRHGRLDRFRAERLDVFAGDVFGLDRRRLGPVDTVYDRAALVALTETLRPRYAAHLTRITNAAPQLVICYQYDQNSMDGPPFSIDDAEIERHYGRTYRLTPLEVAEIDGGLKTVREAREKVWLLSREF